MTTASAFPHAAEQRASCASPQEVLVELLLRSAAEAHPQVGAADASAVVVVVVVRNAVYIERAVLMMMLAVVVLQSGSVRVVVVVAAPQV